MPYPIIWSRIHTSTFWFLVLGTFPEASRFQASELGSLHRNYLQSFFKKYRFLGSSPKGSDAMRFWSPQAPIIIHLDCYNKIPTTGWLEQQIFTSHSLEVEESRIKGLADLVPGEGLLLGLCSVCVLWEKYPCLSLLIRALILSALTLMTTSKPNYLSMAPPLNTIKRGLELWHRNF